MGRCTSRRHMRLELECQGKSLRAEIDIAAVTVPYLGPQWVWIKLVSWTIMLLSLSSGQYLSCQPFALTQMFTFAFYLGWHVWCWDIFFSIFTARFLSVMKVWDIEKYVECIFSTVHGPTLNNPNFKQYWREVLGFNHLFTVDVFLNFLSIMAYITLSDISPKFQVRKSLPMFWAKAFDHLGKRQSNIFFLDFIN